MFLISLPIFWTYIFIEYQQTKDVVTLNQNLFLKDLPQIGSYVHPSEFADIKEIVNSTTVVL